MAAIAKKIQVAVADDHSLLRKALAQLINSFQNYSVVFEADNGKELKEMINKHVIPDIVLLDVNMPETDGYETAQWFIKIIRKLRCWLCLCTVMKTPL